MTSTGVRLSPEWMAREPEGHDAAGKPKANWDFDALAGAGALRSTANDMLTFLAANLGDTKTPLAPAMAAMLKSRCKAGDTGMTQALGWQISEKHGDEIVWKDGATYGYASFTGYNARTHTGVTVMSNKIQPVNDLGMHLLDPQHAVLGEHTQTSIDPKLFDRYMGVYQLAPGALISVTRDGDHFLTQLSGQEKIEVYPEGERDFFYKVVEASLTFTGDTAVLHQNGVDQTAKRTDLPFPKERKEITVESKVSDGYVGKYQLTTAFIITITKEDGKLFLQATGQPKFRIFAETERDFFLRVVDAQVTFEVDTEGKTTALVLHQGGNARAKRIE